MLVPDRVETAALVRETRKRLGLTQVQFAQSLGVSFQSVNRWENRKTKPLLIILKQIESQLQGTGETKEDLLERMPAAEGKELNR